MGIKPEFNVKRVKHEVWVECYGVAMTGVITPSDAGPLFDLNADVFAFKKHEIKEYSGSEIATTVTLIDGRVFEFEVPVADFGKEIRKEHKSGLMDLKCHDLKKDLMAKPLSIDEIIDFADNSKRVRKGRTTMKISMSDGGAYQIYTYDYNFESQNDNKWGNYKVHYKEKGGSSKTWCVTVLRRDEFEQFERLAYILRIKKIDMVAYNRAQYKFWHKHGKVPPKFDPYGLTLKANENKPKPIVRKQVAPRQGGGTLIID